MGIAERIVESDSFVLLPPARDVQEGEILNEFAPSVEPKHRSGPGRTTFWDGKVPCRSGPRSALRRHAFLLNLSEASAIVIKDRLKAGKFLIAHHRDVHIPRVQFD